jgi:RNA polymerase sigma-B factor
MAAILAGQASSEPARAPWAPQMAQVLAGLNDRELLKIIRTLPPASAQRAAACGLLVSRHQRLVGSCVQRYRRSPEPTEDLMQVGYVGLLKAINSFNPVLGDNLAPYAQACISGEIKRHLRDKRWQIHVQRSVKERVLEAREVTRQLSQELGRTPDESDVALHLGISDDELRLARLAEMTLQLTSLDAPLAGRPAGTSLADVLGGDDPGLEYMLDRQALATHWTELPPRQRKILLMRFHGDMTQAEIGQQLGISQMQVSRLLAHGLGYLRWRMLGLPECSSHRPRRARRPSREMTLKSPPDTARPSAAAPSPRDGDF